MAVRPEEIISKIIIDGSGAEEGTARVAMSLNVMQNALSRALGGIDPLVKNTMQLGREMTTLAGHIKNVTTAQADLTKQSESGATALKLLESRQAVLLEMQRRLESGTLSLGQAQAALSGKIKTVADFTSVGNRAFLEFMATVDKTAAAELEHVQATETQKQKLSELRDVLKGAGLDLAAQETALRKVAAAYDPATLAQEKLNKQLVDARTALRGYREELGLEDAAIRKFEEGKQELLALFAQDKTSFAEATALLGAYIQAKDPAIKKDREQAEYLAKLNAQISAYRKELGLAGKDELDFISGRDKLIKTLRDANVPFSEAIQLLEAYTQKYDPAIAKEREAATSASKLAAEREKLKQQMLDEVGAAEKTAAAQKAGYQQAMAAIDPLYAATLNYENGLRKLTEGQKAAGKSDQQLAADKEKLRQNFEKVKQVIIESEEQQRRLAEAGGLSRNSMLMLNASVINTVQSLSAGLPVTMVLMQQLPQLAGAFAQESTALTRVTTAAVAFAGANAGVLVAVGATATAVIASVAANQMYISSMREMTLANQLMGGSLGLSASGMSDFADAAAEAGKVSVASSRTMVADLTRVGRIGATVLQDLIKYSKDYARLTGVDVTEAAKSLGAVFRDPAKGAEELTQQLGLLSGAELTHIRTLSESGQRTAAQTELLEKLRQRTAGAREEVNIFSRSWSFLTRNISDAIDAYGKYLDVRYGGGTTKDKIEANQKDLNGSAGTLLNSLFPSLMANSPLQKRIQELQTQYQDEIRLAAQKARTIAENEASVAADSIAQTLNPIAQEIAKVQSQIDVLDRGLKTGRTSPTANVAGALEAAKNQKADLDYLAQLGPGLTAAAVKNQLLADARLKAATMGEVAGKKYLAQRQTEIEVLGTLTTTGQRKAEVDTAMLLVQAELTASVARQNNQLSLQARSLQNQADVWESTFEVVNMQMRSYDKASADSLLSDARSRAETDALTQAINVNARARQYATEEILKAAGTSAKQIAELTREVEAQQAVTKATSQGIQARAEAENAAKDAQETSDLRAASLAAESIGNSTLATRLRSLADAYVGVAKAKRQATFDDDNAVELEKAKYQEQILREQSAMVGMSSSSQARVKAEREVTEYLRGRGKEYSKLSSAEKAQIDRLINQKVLLGELNLDIQRQEDAWNTVTGSLENAFTKVGDAITEAMAKGELRSISWGNITRAVISSVMQDMFKLALINPLSNAVFGTNKGTIFDLASGSGQTAASQSGVTGMLTNTASNWGMSKAGSWAMDKLGLSGTWDNVMNTTLWGGNVGSAALAGSLTGSGSIGLGSVAGGAANAAGVAAVPGGLTNAVAGSASSTVGLGAVPSGLSTGGATVGGVLGSAGAGGLAGGVVGGLLGTATNSKVVGGLSGAAAGAGSAYLASALGFGAAGGPVGLAIGAIVGGIMGMLGTQKASAGPNGAGNLFLDASGAKSGPAAGDNGMDGSGMLQISDAAASSINTIMSGIGATFSKELNDSPFAHFTFMQKDNKWTLTDQAGNGEQTFDNQDTFLAALLKTAITRMDAEGKVSGVNEDVRTALRNTKATKAEDLANDLVFADTFRDQLDLLNANLDPTNNKIKTFTENAKQIGEAVKTNITDWTSKARELGLATESELTTAARNGIVAMMGLGPAVEPLVGMGAVTKQAEIELEQFKPALLALGYTAAEVAELSSKYTAKLVKNYDDITGLIRRQAETSIQSLINGNARLSSEDQFVLNGTSFETVGTGAFKSITAGLDQLALAAQGGAITFEQVTEEYNNLSDAYYNGTLTADEYANAIGQLTTAFQTSQTVLSTIQAGWIALADAIDPNRKITGTEIITNAGISKTGEGVAGFSDELDTLFENITSGTASVDDLNSTYENLIELYQSGQVNGQQFNTVVQSMVTAWKNATAKMAASTAYLEDINSRMLAAVGLNGQSSLASLAAQQRKELLAAVTAGYDVDDLKLVQKAEYNKTAFDLAKQAVLDAYDEQIAKQEELITTLQDGKVAAAELARQFRSAYDALALDSNSPLSPKARLEEARAQIAQAYGVMKAGTATQTEKDAAAQTLQSLGPSLIELAKQYFASSDVSDYNWIRGIYDEFGNLSDATLSTADKELQVANDTLKELQKARQNAENYDKRKTESLDHLLSVMQSSYNLWQADLLPLLSKTGQTTQATPEQIISGITRDNLAGVVSWARGQGPDMLQRVLVAADSKLGWENNPFRYSAPSDVSNMDGRGFTEDDALQFLRGYGYNGAFDSNANAFIVSRGISDQYTQFLRDRKATHLTSSEKRTKLEAFTNEQIEQFYGSFPDIIAARQSNPEFNLAEWFRTYGIDETLAGTRPIPGFRRGTNSAPAGYALVGEEGAEIVKFGGGEQVFPHQTSRGIVQDWASLNNRGRIAADEAEKANAANNNVNALAKQLEETNRQLASLSKMINFYGKQQSGILREGVEVSKEGNSHLGDMGNAATRQAVRGR